MRPFAKITHSPSGRGLWATLGGKTVPPPTPPCPTTLAFSVKGTCNGLPATLLPPQAAPSAEVLTLPPSVEDEGEGEN